MSSFIGITRLIAALVFLSSLVSMTPESIIEFLLISIKAGVRSSKAVHFSSKSILHVSLIVKVGHIPAILLIVIIMGVCTVVAGGDTLGIWGRGSVIEIVRAVVRMRDLSSGTESPC